MHLPASFVSGLKNILGNDADLCISAIENQPITSIRFNKQKVSAAFADSEPVSWCNEGRYLNERPLFIGDPLFQAGAYYVQESSSMFVAHVFEQIKKRLNKPINVLDLCAAPGGKSTLVLDQLSDDDLLVSNEIIKSRVAILEQNLIKWGRSNVVITNNDPAQIGGCKNYFDVMVIDAPCSGEGMFRKDKKAVEHWSPEHVLFCAQRQKRILTDVFTALKPGGFLIYSTCTFNLNENEENVEWLMNEFGFESVEIPVDKDWEITASNTFKDKSMFSYRFYPHKVKGEGFYITCLQKTFDSNTEPDVIKEVKTPRLKDEEKDLLAPWVEDIDAFFFQFDARNVQAYPRKRVNDIEYLRSKLYVKLAGLRLGEVIKNTLIPDHQLALSIQKNKAIKSIEVDKTDALRFLKKETFFKEGYEQGIYLITHQNHALGWIKALPNRFNNYLPVNWRILKDLKDLI